ncbi:MAG: 16S rRNA (adenine(1518)-N(6)/adenine(1519)-N(6))-dimethyltransferase RsmA [Eggerthellales bacterium]|nr:16S rRNA (adenine(1518)-N(6)/adenine(1519)-N(6))-dimethyltransferase RsmA [Eggerthellales bacterium]
MSTYSYLANPSTTRATLERFGLATKHALGQNFLVNDVVIGRICQLSEVCEADRVLEVGPGIGTLTVALCPRADRVLSVERDVDLPRVLAETLYDYDNFTLISKDALDLTWDDICELAPNKFISNLPYAVAATLVLDYFQRFSCLESATVMVQSEVADRMQATCGCKDYGAYTVKLNLLAQASARFQVSPGNFFPPPHVDSAVIRIDRVERGWTPQDQRWASLAADAAFFTRRKTISNSMKTFFSGRIGYGEVSSQIPALLSEAGIDPRRRGETLSLEEFVTLGRTLRQAVEG